MFIYKTAKIAPVWTTFLKIRAIFVHQMLTEHAFCPRSKLLPVVNKSIKVDVSLL